MDTHDCATISQRSPLEPGCVITIEPGLYIQPDEPDVPEEFRGIGIRLEDDVLITSHKPLVLSHALPLSASEVEAYIQDLKPRH